MSDPAPVVVTVSRIRDEIYKVAGLSQDGKDPLGNGHGSTPLLGWIFHETLAALTTGDSKTSWRALSPTLIGQPNRLRQHVFCSLIGPWLNQNKSRLAGSTEELLSFWQAVSEMCDWTKGMLDAAQESGLLGYDQNQKTWRVTPGLVSAEVPLSWDLRAPGWSRSVRVVGTADAVWRKPRSGGWCVVEYKLGLTSPEADLCQACLYYEMLSEYNSGKAESALAIVRFQPQRNETFYPSRDLETRREWLVQLIGWVAGVSAQDPGPLKRPTEPTQHDELGRKIVKILEEFGSPTVIEGQPVVGPTFVRYTLLPKEGISAKKILHQNLDLQVRLHLDAAPMIHVHEGRLVVDLQRKDRETILFSSVRQKLPLAGEEGNPKVPVGVDLDGTLHFADLSNPVNAHILVAGTAGSGKSEWLRSAIAGLLLTNTPRTLRLVLIDPKRNAFSDLKNSSFLYREDSIVYPPEHSAVEVLEALIEEMESRYRNFEKYRADDLQQYAQRSGDRKPRIVCVCDEYADLVSTDKRVRKEIENSISRLGAKARAAGIHLILATQRPSRDIVSGVLKANMSCKVGLRVQSLIESRLILEVQGAEKLLGYGDLLFCDVGDPVRLQSPFLPEQERNSIFRG